MTCPVGCEFERAYASHSTNFTCEELITYCSAYEQVIRVEKKIDIGVNAVLLVAGCSGFISYLLMILVFRLPEYNGASYIYHKAIIWMELFHMVVMEVAAWLRHFSFNPTYFYVIYNDLLREFWIFGDAMKLSISMLTTFLSMERFVAIWLPASFSVINRPKVVRIFTALSLLTGLLHICRPFAFTIRPQLGNDSHGLYVAVSEHTVSHIGGFRIVSEIIYSVKIITSLAMTIFCIGVAAGLVWKSKKAGEMCSTARVKWRENRRLSILQIGIALMQIIDHIFWVTSFIILDQQPSPLFLGHAAITQPNFSFEQAMETVWYRELYKWSFACQSISGAVDHAMRFPLYWIGMKRFKEGFTGLFRKEMQMAAVLTLKPSAIAPAI